jgi:hypothetical protein
MHLIYALLFLLAGAAIWGAIRWYRGHERETDPIKLRMRQAAKMKWEQTAEVEEDGQGAVWTQRSVRFLRGKEEAVLWYKDATVTLVRDYAPPTFDDFIELEQWIKKNPRDAEVDAATGERLYLREIERFVIRHGHFSPLLEATATHKDFFIAVATFHKAGYLAREAPEVVAALTLDALVRYEKDRNAAFRFLTGLENDFRRTPTTGNSQAE